MERKSGEDRPVGAIETLDTLYKIIEAGKPVYMVLPAHCSEPRLEKHPGIRKNVSGYSIGGWALNDSPLHVPFTGGNGYIFANYWFAYAFHLRTAKCK